MSAWPPPPSHSPLFCRPRLNHTRKKKNYQQSLEGPGRFTVRNWARVKTKASSLYPDDPGHYYDIIKHLYKKKHQSYYIYNLILHLTHDHFNPGDTSALLVGLSNS